MHAVPKDLVSCLHQQYNKPGESVGRNSVTPAKAEKKTPRTKGNTEGNMDAESRAPGRPMEPDAHIKPRRKGPGETKGKGEEQTLDNSQEKNGSGE